MEEGVCDLVARTGRQMQRYEDGCRLVAGCIPFRYINCNDQDSKPSKDIEVLMISSASGPGLLFPKGGWENDETVQQAAEREALEEAGVRGVILSFLGYYHFKSKSHQDEFSPEGKCKAAMFAMQVTEELNSWPECSTRRRRWVAIPEAVEQCRHPWMVEALLDGFSKWHSGFKIEHEQGNPSPVNSCPTG